MSSRSCMFITESRIDASCDQVYAFFADPRSFAALNPPTERLRPLAHWDKLEPGARVVFWAFGGFVPAEWELEVVQATRPRSIIQKMIAGPFPEWVHQKTIMAEGPNSCLLRDSVRFRPRGGRLGRILLKAWVRRRMRQWFDHQHETVLKLLAGRSYDMVGLSSSSRSDIIAASSVKVAEHCAVDRL